jgi:hypothetical protein
MKRDKAARMPHTYCVVKRLDAAIMPPAVACTIELLEER